MKIQNLFLTAAIASVLSACGSTPQTAAPAPNMNIPDWVLNPVVEDGLAASDCIKFSGNMSVDQKMAAANTRVALAQQIEVRVEALDKTYLSRVDANEKTTTGTNFSSVSKQVTQQKLNGSRVIKTGVVNIANKDHLCIMMSLNPSMTQELFKSILVASKREVNPQDEAFLYQEFKAHKAETNLEKEIERLTN